jgi:tRNA/rRNA methyltransferase
MSADPHFLEEFLSRVRVVLTRPTHPGNIGGAARAMQTMGLKRLVLVEPERYPHADATAMASNATAVLDQLVVCSTLDEALAGTTVQVAFTARSRALSHEALPVRETAAALCGLAGEEIALVFGNETYGLSNEEVMKCSRAAFIPTDENSRSLNLAAAVQVAGYALRVALLDGTREANGGADTASGTLADHEDVERFFSHLEQSLYRSGFLQEGNPRRLMERMRRLFGRSGLETEEINILRGMLAAWDGTGGRHGA